MLSEKQDQEVCRSPQGLSLRSNAVAGKGKALSEFCPEDKVARKDLSVQGETVIFSEILDDDLELGRNLEDLPL